MRSCLILSAAITLLVGLTPAAADVFNMGGTRNPDGSWNGLASLETVPVGNAGNPADTLVMTDGTTGYGSVPYEYRIGKYEVTAGQYCEFLNKVAGVDTYGLYTPYMSFSDGCGIEKYAGAGTPASPFQYRVAAAWANRPVNYVGFGDACRFANWLHNGQSSGLQNAATTEDGAYTLNGATSDAALKAVTRKAGWKWAVPSVNEWYKAAYYDAGKAGGPGYWLYPTCSDSYPSNEVLTPDGGNNANVPNNGHNAIGDPYWRTVVGEFEDSASPYGTFDQGGNVWEWDEFLWGTHREVRGGSFNWGMAQASYSSDAPQTWEAKDYGFRVVQVPEPTAGLLLATAGLLLARRRRPVRPSGLA